VSAVLDASALLAYLLREPGEDVVANALAGGLVMSAVNLSEVLSKLAVVGADARAALESLVSRGIVGGTVSVIPFTEDDALACAALRPGTASAGLSLADRGCLALAERLDLPALTADRTWADLNVGVDVKLIR
jgi:PIN domain nuclease of toxin-antitoxin system